MGGGGKFCPETGERREERVYIENRCFGERGRGRGTGKKVRNEKRERLHEKHVSTVHSSSHVGLNWELTGERRGRWLWLLGWFLDL